MLPQLVYVESQDGFDTLHAELCRWGCRALRPSHPGRPRAAYGQVAKTLNVVLKVVVYYSELPNRRVAKRLLPWLHPAIDNRMMKYLRRRYTDKFPVGIKAIADVDKRSYLTLRSLATRDAVENLDGKLHPAQWEDIVWAEVN